VDGCYWHGCPDHHTRLAANAGCWSDQIPGNFAPDQNTDAHLTETGRTALRLWGHEIPRQRTMLLINQFLKLWGERASATGQDRLLGRRMESKPEPMSCQLEITQSVCRSALRPDPGWMPTT
jgi:DNA mismatch endonuclease (patch repair protein)